VNIEKQGLEQSSLAFLMGMEVLKRRVQKAHKESCFAEKPVDGRKKKIEKLKNS
jgi:hypothetical protein